jgi:hypothetical protein
MQCHAVVLAHVLVVLKESLSKFVLVKAVLVVYRVLKAFKVLRV